MSQLFKRVVIQWVPSHCNIPGNDKADRLAKAGVNLPQTDTSMMYDEAKTLINARFLHK